METPEGTVLETKKTISGASQMILDGNGLAGSTGVQKPRGWQYKPVVNEAKGHEGRLEVIWAPPVVLDATLGGGDETLADDERGPAVGARVAKEVCVGGRVVAAKGEEKDGDTGEEILGQLGSPLQYDDRSVPHTDMLLTQHTLSRSKATKHVPLHIKGRGHLETMEVPVKEK